MTQRDGRDYGQRKGSGPGTRCPGDVPNMSPSYSRVTRGPVSRRMLLCYSHIRTEGL